MVETDWREILSFSQREREQADKEKLCEGLSWMEADDIELNFSDLKILFRLDQDILKYKNEQAAIESKRPQLLYANTYQLDPHLHQVFNIPKVTDMINDTLNIHWTGHKYNMSESPALALRIAGETMRKVKNMNFNRYRVISVVTIGEKRAQSYNNAITFLWDHERDRYVDVQRESFTNFIQVTIFGVYLD